MERLTSTTTIPPTTTLPLPLILLTHNQLIPDIDLPPDLPTLIHAQPLPMFLIPRKEPLPPAPIGVEETPKPFPLPLHPTPLIDILDDLVLYLAIEPVVRSETVLQVPQPLALVFLVLGEPVHCAVAVFLVVLPLPVVCVA